MAAQPLPRFLEQRREQQHHARHLHAVVDELDQNLRERQIYHDPADTLTLRGIPAIGRGVQGVIRGTQPDHAVQFAS